MENIVGDCTQIKGYTEEKKTVKNYEEKTEISENNIFQHFYDKYLELNSRPLNDEKDSVDYRKEKKLFIECLIKELNQEIRKTNEKSNTFLRLLSMKIFMYHVLIKFLDDKEAIEAITILEKVINDSKQYLLEPQVIYSVFLIINNLATLKQKINEPSYLNDAKEVLEECQKAYTKFKHKNKENKYYSGKELFSPLREMPSKKEAKIKYEKLVITNLLLLGSIYEKLDEHYKDIICYHTAFKRMLNEGLVNPFKWVDFTTRLACVFIDDNNFKDARHHLAAATHVHEILEEKYLLSLDLAKIEQIRSNSIHLALAWIRYCVILFEKSKDEDRTNFVSLFKNGQLHTHKKSTEKPSVLLECDENLPMNDVDTSMVFQHPKFMESIDKEIYDDDYNEDINENCMGFGDFLDDILKCQTKENYKNLKDDLQIGMVKNEVTQNLKTVDNDINLNEIFKRDEKSNTINTSLNKQKDNTEGKELSKNKDISSDTIDKIFQRKKMVYDKKDNKTEKQDTNKQERDNEEVEEADEEQSNNLTFSSLGYLPIEHSVTKDIIKSPEEAKDFFKFGCNWVKRVEKFYPKNTDFYSYVHVMLNMVSLYRLCAYFQGRDNLEYRISLEQTRESLLEQLVAELSDIQPESHLHVRLYQEMALLNIDLAMLNMCNIYNINTDDTYKLCALAEIQTHLNHVGDILERSITLFDKTQESEENSPTHSVTFESTSTNTD